MTFPEIFDKFKNHDYIRRECWSNDVFIQYRYTAPYIREIFFKTSEENNFSSQIMYEAYKKLDRLPKVIQLINNDIRLSAEDLLANDWIDIENC